MENVIAPATVATPAAKRNITVRTATKSVEAKVVVPKPAVKAAAVKATVTPVVKEVPKATAKAVVKQVPKAVPATAATFKAKTMALAAGLVVALTDKRLTKALSYHTKMTGCLNKTDAGYVLTETGQKVWTAERVNKRPDTFQAIANFVKRGGPIPHMWKNHPPLQIAKDTVLPNPIFWGSFASSEMRLAFVAIWAK